MLGRSSIVVSWSQHIQSGVVSVSRALNNSDAHLFSHNHNNNHQHQGWLCNDFASGAYFLSFLPSFFIRACELRNGKEKQFENETSEIVRRRHHTPCDIEWDVLCRIYHLMLMLWHRLFSLRAYFFHYSHSVFSLLHLHALRSIVWCAHGYCIWNCIEPSA